MEGPAGSAKSQYVDDLLAAGEIDLQADTTDLWAAVTRAVRDASGRFPDRADNDPGLIVSLYAKTAIIRRALSEGYSVAVTASTPGQASPYRDIAEEFAQDFRVVTLDIPRAEAERRLADPNGLVSGPCQQAVARWFQ